MKSHITYYQILSIKEDATLEEIKASYREKVLIFHPDINKHPDAAKVFISLQKAYEVLSNKESRYHYDNYLKAIRSTSSTSNQTTKEAPKQEEKTSVIACCFALFLILCGIASAIFFVVDKFTYKPSSGKTEHVASTKAASSKPKEAAYSKPKEAVNNTPKENARTIEYKERYYIDNDGNIHVVQKGKEQEFLSNHSTAREATMAEVSAYENRRTEKTGRKAQETKQQIPTEHATQELNYSRPQNGTSPYNSFYGKGVRDSNSLGEITIINGTSQDALVVFYEVRTGKIMRNLYIRAYNSSSITQVPQGNFRMKTFYGENWVSNLDNGTGNPKGGFTKNVSFSKMANYEMFKMNWEEVPNGISYPTYSVTLHKVTDGNLQTKDIDKNEFFNQ